MKCDLLETEYLYEDRVITPATRRISYYRAVQVDEAINELKAIIAQLEDDNALLRKNNAELRKENEDLKNELSDAKRDACRFEKAMYRALMNWAHARSFIYLKEHHASIDSEIPSQWKRAMTLCGLGYEFAKIVQDELPKKTKAPEVK